MAVEPAEAARSDSTTATAAQRERLATIAAGGQARQYLGKAWTVEQIDALGDDEAGKLYARYEARLGAAMTKTLGRAALQLYTAAASFLLPIPPENQKPLMEELESDPFVGHALTSTACELYYRYGKLLAPITAALTTVKYCQFRHQCPRRIEKMEDDSNVMATPTPVETSPPGPEDAAEPRSQPAQPVLRVTAETTSRSPRQKDPKKVAAGRVGAAARKAKSERLERELVAAKESPRDPTYAAPVAPPAPPAAHSNEEASRGEKKEAAGSMPPGGVGVLVAAAGGLAYWLQRARAEPPPQKEEKKPSVLSPERPAQQLKVAHNPHYME